jgi:hypothetical protein
MLATAIEDLRCTSLFDSAVIVTRDPRYKCLHRRVDIEVEDSRCISVAIAMEDPRCKGLSLNW